MNTPVLIAARNEAAHIGSTLEALSRQLTPVQPIVIVNGSSDDTAKIARDAGAVVLNSPEGKLPALQAGLRFLKKRALEPVLILDADSRPFTKKWSRFMTGRLLEASTANPVMVWGQYVYRGDINPLLATIFTAARIRVAWSDRGKSGPRLIRGGDMGLYLKRPELLVEILALDNYWPREDAAIYDKVKSFQGEHCTIFKPDSWALTSASRITNTMSRMAKDHRHPSLVMDGSYAADAPAGSRPYNSKTTQTSRH